LADGGADGWCCDDKFDGGGWARSELSGVGEVGKGGEEVGD
jgi:hypothetical protein